MNKRAKVRTGLFLLLAAPLLAFAQPTQADDKTEEIQDNKLTIDTDRVTRGKNQEDSKSFAMPQTEQLFDEKDSELLSQEKDRQTARKEDANGQLFASKNPPRLSVTVGTKQLFTQPIGTTDVPKENSNLAPEPAGIPWKTLGLGAFGLLGGGLATYFTRKL